MQEKNRSYLKSVFNWKDKIFAFLVFFIWLGLFFEFAYWWFNPKHVTSNIGFALVSITVFWLLFLYLYMFIFSLRQKKLVSAGQINFEGRRAALITTKTVVEPWEIVKGTLIGMLNQNYVNKYDVWLADEHPTQQTLDWCHNNGVKISCRKDDSNYHNHTHPRRARSKEGNLAFFYDNWGYNNYDFVIQFDADHTPEPEFLTEIMTAFLDPEVGYVASPSICDRNLGESWTVRARVYWESLSHGPTQSGSHSGLAPLCFGSHYSLRTKALKDIGGIGPEEAEDHTTTMLMNSHGWKGAFARDAIAHGNGAVGVLDSIVQEFQWAKVSTRASAYITPKYLKNLTWKVGLQFIFWESWYPIISFVTLLSYFLPLTALYTQTSFTNILGAEFTPRYLLLNSIPLLFILWLRFKKCLRPTYSFQLSWETFIFQIIQFPWIVLGVFAGLFEVITKRKASIKITPKENKEPKKIPNYLFLPHYIIIYFNIFAIIYFDISNPSESYKWFCFFVAISNTISIFAALILTIYENSLLTNSKGILKMFWELKLNIIFISLALMFLFNFITEAISTQYLALNTETLLYNLLVNQIFIIGFAVLFFLLVFETVFNLPKKITARQ